MRHAGVLPRLVRQAGELLARGLDVRLELQQHVQRVAHQIDLQHGGVQQHHHPRPVDRLADRGHLLQVQRAQLLHEADQLLQQPRIDARHAGGDDPGFQLLIREADMQVQAAAFQRVAQVAGAVGGQQHDRRHDAWTVPISGIVTW